MVECVWPELDGKVGSSEESPNRIREGSVSALNRSILERSFSTSGSDFVPLGGEEVSDNRVVVKLASLV
jgi:hypothetical protein